MKIGLYTFLSAGALLLASQAHAWSVNCGSRAIYYRNGSTMVSSSGSFYYPNGSTLISSSGAVYFSNGSTFQSSSGALYYPNGSTLRSSSGSFYYPNGSTARSSSGTCYRPDGSSTQFPVALQTQLSSDIPVTIHAQCSGSDSYAEFTLSSGHENEHLNIMLRPDSVSCGAFGGGPDRFTIQHSAADVSVTVKRSLSPARVREALVRALDQL